MANAMMRENTGTMFMEDEISSDFGPYSRVASRIDDVLSALTFTKMMGNVKDTVRLNKELTELQSEIARIKQRNRHR